MFIQREKAATGDAYTGRFELKADTLGAGAGSVATITDASGRVIGTCGVGGSIVVPQGANYRISVVTDGVVRQEALAVGVSVLAIGQSNMAYWSGGGSGRAMADGTYQFGGGARSFAVSVFTETLQKLLGGAPVSFIQAAVGGSALLPDPPRDHWTSSADRGLYQTAVTKVQQSSGGRVEVVLWNQGETEVVHRRTKAEYKSGLDTLFSRLKADLGDFTTVMMGIGGNRLTWPSPTIWAGIDQAKQDWVAEQVASGSKASYTATPKDLPTGPDNLHLDKILYGWVAYSAAREAAASILGQPVSSIPDIRITGTSGNDVLTAAPGELAYLFGGNGNDSLQGGDRDDMLIGGNGNDTLLGGLGDDGLTGNAGDDSLAGMDGNDDLIGGNGNDTLDGGSGNDSLVSDAGNDVLVGGLGDDTLSAGAGNDSLDGGDGADVLDGSLGADTMVGGAGDDVYFVDNVGDQVFESADGGRDTIRTSLAVYRLGEAFENLFFVGTGAFAGTGNDLGNAIAGGGGADTLVGMGGADGLSGGGGNDSLDGGDGADVLNGGGGADTMRGGAGADTFYVDNLGDVVEDASAGDFVYVTAANYDTSRLREAGARFAFNVALPAGQASLAGGDWNDTLTGSGGATILGGKGNDLYVVDGQAVVVEAAGEGIDTVRTSASAYVLGDNIENLAYTGQGAFHGSGNALNNGIVGGAGADTLFGLDGNDTMLGGAGADVLWGGRGIDQLSGGAGDDTFVFRADDAVGLPRGAGDWIRDFETGDRIDLTRVAAETNVSLHFDGGWLQKGGGSVAFNASTGILSVDWTGDGKADLSIKVTGTAVTASSLIL